MYNHQPKDELCVFCSFANHQESEYKKLSDIVFEDAYSLAFISPKWWTNNPGHVILIPKKHYENVYDIPDNLLSHQHIVAKKLMRALKETYNCEGTSLRQHNEPAGNQAVWHYHINIFPRYTNDNLYKNHDNKHFVTAEERKPYADKLREYFGIMKP
jgi:histidine triad (HIT) family protein